MNAPDPQADESLRLASLHRLGLLDTPPHERYDRITRLAARLCRTSMAYVALAERHRVWFKSVQGLPLREMPRDLAMCSPVVATGDVLVIADTVDSPGLAHHPLVRRAPHIRFFAAVPVRTADGALIGTLAVADPIPRAFGDEDLSLLMDLARMVEREFDEHQRGTMDELTQLSNRRGFELLAAPALGLCRRLGAPAMLLLFDLECFAALNARHGHDEGDRALRDFATLLRQTFRESDLVGRLRADTFAVLATNLEPARQGIVLSRLRQGVDHHNRVTAGAAPLHYRVTTLAVEPDAAQGIDRLLDEGERQIVRTPHDSI